MNKKRLFILTALILAVCIVFSMFAVACDKDDPNNKDEDKESTLLFTNGTFAEGSDDSALRAPSNWTGAPGSSSGSSTATPAEDKDLTKGVVKTSDSGWKALKKKYSHISVSSPGRGRSSDGNDELDDDDVLMINNRTATSYKYTSDSQSIDTDSYYKLSVDVRTILDSDNTDPLAGAYIYVNGAAYARWEAINTQNEWKTYTMYIETSEISSGSITVVLSLGIGNKSTGHMTKGLAFFDNVVLEKVSEVDEKDENAKAFTKEDYDKVEVKEDVAKYTMKVSDSEFDYASSTTSTPYSVSKYSQVAGFGSGDNASTSTSYVAKGIIDTATFNQEGVKSSLNNLVNALKDAGQTLEGLTTPDSSVGTRMLYMQNKQATAFGYRAESAMNFKLNKFYKVSIFARTYLKSGKASIRLTDGTNTDSNNYVMEVDTDGQWVEYSFYVAANQFRASQLKLEMWLGYGGAGDTDTHAVGAALFDKTTISEVTKAEYDGASETSSLKKISLLTSYENMTAVDLSKFAVQNPDDLNAELAKRSKFELIDTDSFTAGNYFKENPGKPVDIENTAVLNSKVLAINNFAPTANVLSTLTKSGNNINTDNLIDIAPNKAYAISMYIKTKDIDKAQGMSVSLLRYNEEYKADEDDDFANAFTTLASFDNLNTENLEDEKGFNDYTLITFYVLGEQIKHAKLAISITMGTGNGSDYSTLVMGYGFVSSMYVEKIPYSQYSSATASTTVKKQQISSSSTSSTNEVASNGYFNNIDISATNNLFGNDIIDDDGNMKSALALPNNWTINSSSSLSIEAPFNNLAGVLNLNNASQLEAMGIDSVDGFFSGLDNSFTLKNVPNVLAIKKDDSLQKLGFTSNSISLAANSYFTFSVYAKALEGSEYSIVLKTATENSEDYKFANIKGDGEWHHYMIFIATGISSTSVTLSLNAGSDTSASASSTVFFTGATYVTESGSDVFDEAEKNDKSTWLADSWLIDSFDDVNASDDGLASPKNFTGAAINTGDDDNSGNDDVLVSGVIDKNKTDYSTLDLDVDGDDNEIINAIFNNEKTNIGDRVLAIYNKDATAYGYTSNTATIAAGKYYKISIWLLTYKLALNGKAEGLDENFKPTATITLKANNKTYEFGRKLSSSSSDYDKQRIVNTSTYDEDGNEKIGQWTEYSFYIYAEEDIEDTTATLTVSLGFKGSNYNMTGYVFADNFSVEEIEESDFIARKDVYKEAEDGKYFKNSDGTYVLIDDANPAPAGATLYNKLTDSEVAKDEELNEQNSILADESKVKNNFRIVFTADDSKAEPEPEEEEKPEKKKDPLMWLYISLGAVSGLIVVIVVIYLIKKYMPKKKKKLIKNSKKSSASNKSKRDQFSK